MATLTISALALGMDAGRIRVHIRLADGDYNTVAGTYGSGSIVERITEYTASDGTLSVDLVPNASITPANTYYVVWVGQERFLIEKSAATQTLSAALVADPNILESVLATTRLSDVSDTVASASGTALLWNSSTSQWEPESDLSLVDPVRAAGAVTGGVIRSATGLIFPWTYSQSTDPTDVAIGTAVHVDWQTTITAGGPYGPQPQTAHFGPRGVYNLEGDLRYGVHQTQYGFSPVGFADTLMIRNTAGVARTLVPAWSFLSARLHLASGAVVTQQDTDVNSTGAAFVDSVVVATTDAGTWDGVTNDCGVTSFDSMPQIVGNTSLAKRIGYHVFDVNGTTPTDWEVIRSAVTSLSGDTCDAGEGTVALNVGVEIDRLTFGTTNAGLLNHASTVESPVAQTIDAASDTVPISATTVHLSNTTGSSIALTSTPTIPDGLDGQRLTLVNVGADPVVIQSEAALTGSNVATGRTLASGTSLTLSWVTSLGQWVELDAPADRLELSGAWGDIVLGADSGATAALNLKLAAHTHYSAGLGMFFGSPVLSFGSGGGDPDTFLWRSSPGLWSVGTSGLAPGSIGNISGETFVERSDPAAPAANGATLYCRDNGSGKTQLCVRFSSGAVQVIATQP